MKSEATEQNTDAINTGNGRITMCLTKMKRYESANILISLTGGQWS